MRNLIKVLFVVIILILCGNCATRTVYVPHGQAVRLREEMEDVDIWVKDKDGNIVAGNMTIHEGWFCLPDPGE